MTQGEQVWFLPQARSVCRASMNSCRTTAGAPEMGPWVHPENSSWLLFVSFCCGFAVFVLHDLSLFGNLFGRQRSRSVKELQPGLWVPNVVARCCLLWAWCSFRCEKRAKCLTSFAGSQTILQNHHYMEPSTLYTLYTLSGVRHGRGPAHSLARLGRQPLCLVGLVSFYDSHGLLATASRSTCTPLSTALFYCWHTGVGQAHGRSCSRQHRLLAKMIRSRMKPTLEETDLRWLVWKVTQPSSRNHKRNVCLSSHLNSSITFFASLGVKCTVFFFCKRLTVKKRAVKRDS